MESSQDNLTFTLSCPTIKSLNKFTGGDVSFLARIAAFKEGIEFISFEVTYFLIGNCLSQLFLVYDSFFMVV